LLVAQWSTDAENMDNSEEQRAEAAVERDNAQALVTELNAMITAQEGRRVEVQAEVTVATVRLDEATTFLAEAEETRARMEMAKQEEEVNAFKE
jgi:hypothetical protein